MVTTVSSNVQIEDDRTGISVETIKRAFLDNLYYVQAKFPKVDTKNDYYMALAYTVRDRLLNRWLNTNRTYLEKISRIVTYLSAEFLMGPHLGNNLINLGLYDVVNQAVEELGLNLADLLEQEEEPGLGNGGLGRLAACYQESTATLEIPAIGYGIRYEYGIFDQRFKDGWQVEITDKWLRYGNPWEVVHPEAEVEVNNSNDELKLVIDRISSGFFSHGDSNLFKPLVDSLLHQDQYLLFADYQSYVECQDGVSRAYRDQDHWTRISILNVARISKFSSDRSISDYRENIWKAPSVQVEVPDYSQTNGDVKLSW